MLVKVLPIEVSVPLIDDSEDVMLLRVLCMLVMPELMFVNELETEVSVEVMPDNELSMDVSMLLKLDIWLLSAVVPVTLSEV